MRLRTASFELPDRFAMIFDPDRSVFISNMAIATLYEGLQF